jgi:5'-3' exonuclease
LLAIIDGDVLAYQACRTRWNQKARQIDDTILVELDAEGKKVPAVFTEEEDALYLRQSWDNFVSDVQDLLDKLYCTEYLMAVKGENNYRDQLYPLYKANRHTDPKYHNKFVPFIRQLAVFEGLAVPSHGREADDLVRIWAEEARSAGKEFIVCSIDKDLRCIPGEHFITHYDPAKQLQVTVTPEEARRFYYQQLIQGDPVDNIPGIPGVGKVKAAKMVADCDDETELQEIVVSQYIMAYGDEWYDYFVSNAKMIHIQTRLDDYFDCRNWPIIKELCSS